MGLPDAYDTLVVSLDSTEPGNFTLDHVIGRLLNEESCKTPTSTREASFQASYRTRPVSKRNEECAVELEQVL
ncbi:hypothetical protein B0H17DRAFT_1216264 [Mycena rosella]|uniref:Uncharacterized protein n=1 Tax=Mycena rosella TaxID=1033263 RepID=A0AAD7C9R7_MYCRO|nr:hypothetical protein B0H17DRAFT_1216264 [Mycena rosella]